MDAGEAALNAPLKCTPEERKHFAEPALKEAQNANYATALDTVESGLNAHPASEGLLFLKAYFGYKVAEDMSNQLSTFPRVIQSIGAGALMIDGAMTSQLLSKFQEILNTLSEAEESINELLQVNPKNKEVVDFKGYIDAKRQQLDQESENMKTTFIKSPQLAGGFCVGCHKSISYESQKVVFQRSSDSRLQAWHLGCFPSSTGN